MTPAQFKEARRKLGFSLSQMAAALSDPETEPQVSPRTISYWESGQRKVPGPVAVLIKFMLNQYPVALIKIRLNQ